jgi:hypothetical protein
MSRIGIDLDGVLYDFAASLRRYLFSIDPEGTTAHVHNREPSQWEFWPEWNMSYEDWLEACHNGVDAGFVFQGPARPLAAESVRVIKNAGHEVHIITDRTFGGTPGASAWATREWLNHHRIPFDTLTFSPDKTKVETDKFVEDKLSNYDALVASGSDAYLINRPWNADPPHCGIPKRKRINSIAEFAWIVTGTWPRVGM